MSVTHKVIPQSQLRIQEVLHMKHLGRGLEMVVSANIRNKEEIAIVKFFLFR